MSDSAIEPLYLSCHCQAHILEIHQPADQRGVAGLMKLAMTCDCSICVKRRGIWWHLDTPGAEHTSLEVKKGFGKDGVELLDYSFSNRLAYQSCRTCGTNVCIKWLPSQPLGGEIFAINMRALRDPSMRLQDYAFSIQDISKYNPQYSHVTLDDVPGAVEYLTPRKAVFDHPTEIYAGSCHCKAISFVVLCKPLEEVAACDCTCSLCQGNGLLWIYPGRRNVYFANPSSPSTPWAADPSLVDSYQWGPRIADMWNCKICSCMIYWSVGDPRDPEPEKAMEPHQSSVDMDGDFEEWDEKLGLNAALLTDINRFVGDVHNTHPEGSGRDAPRGMKGKSVDEKGMEEPVYRVKL